MSQNSDRSQADDMPERVVAGRYRLVREAGRGGMGQVWLAEDTLLNRQVAVKELRPAPWLTDTARQAQQSRALQEARSAARITHPGAVTLHEIVPATAQDEAVYLIMELVEGTTLAEMIAADGPLPASRVADYGLQLLDVLEAAHALGIVHRDVKPGNIIIAGDGRVKLADFGIAYIVGDPRRTSGGVMGTESYMAPELFDPGPITPAADLWSLGATLYTAVEGSGPFDRDSSPATLRAILLDDLPVPGCEASLATAITGLLRREPAERATIEETRARLRTAAGQQVPEQQPAHPTQPSHPAQPASRPADSQVRPRRLAWDPSAVTGVRTRPDVPAAAPPDATPKKRRLSGFPRRVGRRTVIAAVAVLIVISAATAGVLATHLNSGRIARAGLSPSPVASTGGSSSSHTSLSPSPSSVRTPTPIRSRITTPDTSPAPLNSPPTASPSSQVVQPSAPGGGGLSGITSPPGPPLSPTHPATEPGNPVAYVFWKGAKGDLWEARGPAKGKLSGPLDLAGMGTLGSGPTAGVDGKGDIYVYWEGSTGNHDLWEAYWNGSRWSGPYDRGMGPLGSAPSVAVTASGTAYVFWEGSGRYHYLWEASGPAEGKLGGPYRLIAMGSLGSGPAAGVDGKGDICVYWEGTYNGHLWEAYWDGSAWTRPERQVRATLDGGAPSAAVTRGGAVSVFWKGPQGNLWEAQGPAAGTLSGPFNRGMGVIWSGPAAGVDSSGNVYAYWEGLGDKNLWGAYWDGSELAGPDPRIAATLGSGSPAVVIYG